MPDEAATVFPTPSCARREPARRRDPAHQHPRGECRDMLPHSFLGARSRQPHPRSWPQRLRPYRRRTSTAACGRASRRSTRPASIRCIRISSPGGAPREHRSTWRSDAGTLIEDRLGTLVNPQTWTAAGRAAARLVRPDRLAGSRPDATRGELPARGLHQAVAELHHAGNLRDVWLEHAIVD